MEESKVRPPHKQSQSACREQQKGQFYNKVVNKHKDISSFHGPMCKILEYPIGVILAEVSPMRILTAHLSGCTSRRNLPERTERKVNAKINHLHVK